jgi:transposase
MPTTELQLQIEVANITQERDLLQLKFTHAEEAYSQLLLQFKQMQRQLFGQRSERYIDPNDPQQSLRFSTEDENETSPDLDTDEDCADQDAVTSTVTSIAAHKRRKNGKKVFAEHLPRVEVIIPVAAHDLECRCGCQKKVIKHEEHERLHYIPPVFEVIIEKREVVACPKGCQGEMKTAPTPKHILPKAKFTSSVLAHIIVSKLDDRQPYYHLEKQFKKRAGFDFSRATMASATIKCATELQPLVNLFKDEIIDHDIGGLDATGLQVLKEPGRPAQRKSYVYCMRGGPPGKESIIYRYNAEKHKLFVDEWFEGFSGTLHCDGDPFFDLMFNKKDINPNVCNAHARRKFEPIAKATTGEGLAKQAMRFYKRLYKIERKAKDQGLSHNERHRLRQQESKPLMAEFKQWLDKYAPTTLPKSSLGKAFRYCLKFWDGLCEFLNDGRLEIDNNLTEQEIKPFVIARKNFMFSTSVDGAHALCLHFSLIRTAKRHNLDPYRYYVKVLEQIPYCETLEDYEALLPWNIALPAVGEMQEAA